MGPNTASGNTIDTDAVNKLLNSASNDVDTAKQSGVSQDQLDALNSHEGNNMWTSMFMNLVASANGVNAAPFEKPFQDKVAQEKQNLLLQNQISNQKLNQAVNEQNFGMGQLKAGQELQQQNMLQSPLNNIQKGTLLGIAKQGGIDIDPNDLDQMNQMQYNNIMGSVEKAAQLKNMSLLYGSRGISTGIDPITRQPILINKVSGTSSNIPLPSQNGNTSPGQKIPISQDSLSDIQKELANPSSNKLDTSESANPSFHEILAGRQDSGGPINMTPAEQQAIKTDIPKLANDYQKNYGVPDNQFYDTIGKVNSLLTESQNGNYKAANSLVLQLPGLLGGLGKQRITNKEIELENDPTASGPYQQLTRTIQGLQGKGKITPTDAKNIQDSVAGLTQAHENMLNNVKNQYVTRANQVSPKFQDYSYMFGKPFTPTASSENVSGPSSSTSVKSFGSSDDLLNHLNGG